MSGWRAASVAILVGAVVLGVGWLIGRSDGDGGSTPPEASGSGHPTLACPAALDAACRAAADVVGTVTLRYRPGDPVPEGSVVLAAAGDLPAGQAEGASVVGRSPIVITMWRERALVLESSCSGAIDVACLASAYGAGWDDLGGDAAWGLFKLGLADPTGSQAGLAAWWLIAGAGVPDGLGDSLRLRADDDGALLVEMAQFGDSRVDAAVASEAAVAAQLENVVGRGGRLEVFYPDPGPWIDVVASGAGRQAARLIERLLESDVQDALAGAGLRPVYGSTGLLPEGLGEPGTESQVPAEADLASLVEAWLDS